jgi:hypothetical protein
MINAGAKRIIAVEPAERMVAIANSLIAEQGITDRVEIIPETFMQADLPGSCDISIAIGFYDYIPDYQEHLKKVRMFTTKTMIATFPRAGTGRARIRKARLKLRGCPSYYYTREQLDGALRESGYHKWSIDRFGQLLFVVAQV